MRDANGGNDMLKIGEFSKLTNVSIRMLHHYDAIGLLTPAEIDHVSGYRLYSVTQIPTLQKIIMLRDLNFRIPEIEDILHNWSDEDLIEKLNKKIAEKESIIYKEKQQIQHIEMAIDSVRKKQMDVHYNIHIKQVPATWIISLRKKIADFYEEGVLWKELCAYVEDKHIPILKNNDNNMAIYHQVDTLNHDIDIEIGFLLKQPVSCHTPLQCRKVDGIDTVASIMVSGEYKNIAIAYESFSHWLKAHPQYTTYGASRQICHRDHSNEEQSSDYLTEIQIPIRIQND